MKKITIIKTISLATLILGLGVGSRAASAHMDENHMASTTSGYNVMVMKHLCNSAIKNMEDFKALEAGRDPVAALANTVLNCPTTGLPGDMPVAGTVASPRMTYDFKVMGEHHGAMWLSKDGEYTQHKLSEADINKDVDGDGTIASSTALDISHYEFSNMMADNGRIEVMETHPPAGFKFGTIRFTPPAINGNNDQQALLSTDEAQGRIQLDMTNDKDRMVMLHVYNFMTKESSGATSGTTTASARAMIMDQINALFKQILNLLEQLKQV